MNNNSIHGFNDPFVFEGAVCFMLCFVIEELKERIELVGAKYYHEAALN